MRRESDELAREFNTPELRSIWVKRWDKIGDVETDVMGRPSYIEEVHDELIYILTVEEYEKFDSTITKLFREGRDGEIVKYIAQSYIDKVHGKKSRKRIKRKVKPSIRIKRKA